MDVILTLRSFTCSSTSLSLSNPVSYDVGIARMKASQIDHVPQSWRPSHSPVHLASVYAFASTSRRVLHLPLRPSKVCTRLANILHDAKEAHGYHSPGTQ